MQSIATDHLATFALAASAVADNFESGYRDHLGLGADTIIVSDTALRLRADAHRLARTLTHTDALAAAATEATAKADRYEAGYRAAHGLYADDIVVDETLALMRAEASNFASALAGA